MFLPINRLIQSFKAASEWIVVEIIKESVFKEISMTGYKASNRMN